MLLYCALFSTPSSGITYLTAVVYSTVDVILSFARSTILKFICHEYETIGEV
jgi:hypothetical protein